MKIINAFYYVLYIKAILAWTRLLECRLGCVKKDVYSP